MKTPDWYWSQGLHDAKIISADFSDKALIFKIDCDGALYEKGISEIRLLNYKILTDDFDTNSLTGGWWLSDELSQKGNEFVLKLRFDTKKCKTRWLTIKFQDAEVIKS